MHRGAAAIALVAMFAFAGVVLAVPNCTADHCIYLPSANNGSESTSTPVAPTPTPNPVTLLTNGDFEQGMENWLGVQGQIGTTFPPGGSAHSGTQAAWLHSINGLPALIYTAVGFPSDKRYLSYWVWIQSTEPGCNQDFGNVKMSDGVGNNTIILDRFPLCANRQTNGWVERTVDIFSYPMRGGLIEFSASSTNGLSDLVIDDIGFRNIP